MDRRCKVMAKARKQAAKNLMKCNKPVREKKGQKTHKVKACEDGVEKLIRYGHSMPDRDKNPKAKKNFRSRHKCDQKKSKLTAGYWSCKNW